MANFTSIARPYALAAFECARDAQQLSEWKAFLETASYITRQPGVAALLSNPDVSPAVLFNLYQEILASQLNPSRKNFLLLMSQHKRLNVLSDVSDAFNAHFAALEKSSNVRVITAVEVQDDFKQKLAKALTKRIHKKVTLECEIDPSILGGAVIHIGDRVIDGSIRGKLTRLLETLTG